ncbi:heterokaryon incompatibility protein [Botrytis cinerea]
METRSRSYVNGLRQCLTCACCVYFSRHELGMLRERPSSYCHIIDFNWNNDPLCLRMQSRVFRNNQRLTVFYDGPLSEQAWAWDRLPAISGIAGFFQRQLGVDCLAGLWRRNLPQGVPLENLGSNCYPLGLPLRYRAPSRSWVAADYPPKYEEIKSAEFCVLSSWKCAVSFWEGADCRSCGWLAYHLWTTRESTSRILRELKGSSGNLRLAVWDEDEDEDEDVDDYSGTHFSIDFLLEVETVQIEEDELEEGIFVPSRMKNSNL